MADIRKEADRILRAASAYGRFPTPVEDIIAAAKLKVEKEASLDVGYLSRMYKRVSGTIKHAVDKVWGLFHSGDQLIYLDLSVVEVKQRFVSLHETGHGFLPWQKDLYALLDDGEAALDPDAEEGFERQAKRLRIRGAVSTRRLRHGSPLVRIHDQNTDESRKEIRGVKLRGDQAVRFEEPVCLCCSCAGTAGMGGGPGTYIPSAAMCSIAFILKAIRFDRMTGVFYTNDAALASKLPTHFKRKMTTRCRIPSPVPGDAERFYLEAFDTTHHTFALVFPESEIKAIKAAALVA